MTAYLHNFADTANDIPRHSKPQRLIHKTGRTGVCISTDGQHPLNRAYRCLFGGIEMIHHNLMTKSPLKHTMRHSFDSRRFEQDHDDDRIVIRGGGEDSVRALAALISTG